MNEERLLQTFLELVQIDSESGNERGVADYLTGKLLALGFQVVEDQAGETIGGNAGNVYAYLDATGPGKSLLFSAHMDTVKPGNGIKPVIKDGVIYSDGTTILGSDDKSGLAAILEAVTAVVESNRPHGMIQLLLPIAEEQGLDGMKYFAMNQLRPFDGAYFLDSEGLPSQIITQAPVNYELEAEFVGLRAHAGIAPELGINAIVIAAHAVANMKLGRLDEVTTANIGLIHGGDATNIVPDRVTIQGECRSLDAAKAIAQRDHMIACCEAAAASLGGSVNIKSHCAFAAINVPADAYVVELARRAAKQIGLTPVIAKGGGGSDANILCGHGHEAVILGCGMTRVHSLDEHIEIADLQCATEMVMVLIALAYADGQGA